MDTVFTLAGAFGSPKLLNKYLRGQVTDGRTVVPVTYPNWRRHLEDDIREGARILDEHLTATPGKKIVFGHSLGAVASTCWLRLYAATSPIPVDELEFIFIGNSVRAHNGYYPLNDYTQVNGKPFAPSELFAPLDPPYKVTDIAVQYDGWCDWPDLDTATAVSNAKTGKWLHHLSYGRYPLDRPDYRKHTEGNITYVLIPVNQWWQRGSRKAEIEAGYRRPMQAR